jgi:3-oxoacyl-[acyl-carrier protein] reductase
MPRLDNKIALVTGGTRGIGRAIVVALADAGATVSFTYKSAVPLAEEVQKEQTARGHRVFAYQADAASTEGSAKVVDQVIKECGRLDILVNNAGITRDGLLMRMSEVDWDEVIANNLKSVFNFTKAAIRQMISQKSGKIITISSIVGVTGNAGQANYAASKAGIIGFTKSVAKEVASRNIQVNVVAPGFVETDMTSKLTEEQQQAIRQAVPLRRTAQAHEIAGVVAFLASSDADYMTGQVICVDGGLSM